MAGRGAALAADLGVLRTERSGHVGVTALRRSVGHAVGMLCSVAMISQAPRIIDAVVCTLAGLGLVAIHGGCTTGSAGLGEGGLSFAWSMALPLLGLVLIMEAALWLQRLYAAPVWLPPVVVALGCPTLLALLGGFHDGFPWFMWQVGVVMGLPVVLAFTAYWLPLKLATSDAAQSGKPQNNEMQLTAHG